MLKGEGVTDMTTRYMLRVSKQSHKTNVYSKNVVHSD
jgi:hypothetical protein